MISPTNSAGTSKIWQSVVLSSAIAISPVVISTNYKQANNDYDIPIVSTNQVNSMTKEMIDSTGNIRKEIPMTKTEEMIMNLQSKMDARFNAIEVKLAVLESDIRQTKDTVIEMKKDYAKISDLKIAMLSFKNWIFVTIFGLIAGSIGAGVKELITHIPK